jgi:two-component system nitrate/nitrite sensor histidine kinase NarQ
LSYKQIKWLILTIPTLTIGLWEYVRHEFLLPYISMELGNWLAPIIVFLVTMLFLTQLFSMIEHNQEELNVSRGLQAALEEREKIARELHDGIAQSLFLLNVQVDRIERTQNTEGIPYQEFKESIHRTHAYVRDAISNLRYPADAMSIPWMQGLKSLIDELHQETELQFAINWQIPEDILSRKEKLELLASIRESLLNIHKHADARQVIIEASLTPWGWQCSVTDDGIGFNTNHIAEGNRYGIRMIRDRALMMGWIFALERQDDKTVVTIRKGDKP